MKNYLASLRQESAHQITALQRKKKRDASAAWEPLEAQIQRWWVNLPEAVRLRPFQLTEIAGACRGRYQERPALRCVAQALRVLGWREKRCWTKAGRNRRYWRFAV